MPPPGQHDTANEDYARLRAPRGSYSKLKCLQCRSRKIKCILPNPSIQASSSPQSPETSCIRCQQQGLDCIVDKTVLGRPSQKRRRSASFIERESSAANDDEKEEAEGDVEAFVLSHVQSAVDEIDRDASLPRKSKPSRHEIFSALVDSTCLLSALLAQDTSFASEAVPKQPNIALNPFSLVDGDMLFAMDEQYARKLVSKS